MSKRLSKRQQEKSDYIAERVNKSIQLLGAYFPIDKDKLNPIVCTTYKLGFDDGYEWYKNHPIGMLDEDYAWAIYNFINDWKMGKYGEVGLQIAIRDNFRY